MTQIQRNVTVQAFLICLFIYMCAVFYVGFEFFPNLIPSELLILSFFGWQWSFCGVVLVYMVMNNALSNGVLTFYGRIFGVSRNDTTMTPVTIELSVSANVY